MKRSRIDLFLFSIVCIIAGCAHFNEGLKTPPPEEKELTAVEIYNSDTHVQDFLFISTAGIVVDDGIKYVSGNEVEDISFNLSALPSQVKALKDINGKLYVCSSVGLFEISPLEKRISGYFSSDQSLSSDMVNDICGNKDILYIATDNGLTIHTLDPTLNIQFEKYRGLRTIENWFSVDSENSPLESDNCLKCELREEILAIVTDKDIVIYNTTLDTVENYPVAEVLDGREVTDVVFQGESVYFSTYNGLFAYDTIMQSWNSYPIEGIVKDGRIIDMVPNGGKIFAFSPTQIYYFDTFSRTYDLIFNLSDFPGSNFTSIGYFQGTLFIGTSNGLVGMTGDLPPSRVLDGSVSDINASNEEIAVSDGSKIYYIR